MKERANKDSATKRVNDLMKSLYSLEYMASHSLTGQASGSTMSARDAMDQDVVEEIIRKYLRRLSYNIIVN